MLLGFDQYLAIWVFLAFQQLPGNSKAQGSGTSGLLYVFLSA